MDRQHAYIKPVVRASTSLRGRPLFVAQAALVAVAALTLVLFAVAVPVEFEYLRTPCTECAWSQITPEGERRLEELGLTIGFYASCVLVLEAGFAAVSFVVSAAIFLRKPDDTMALLASLTLLVWGATFPDALFVLEDLHPIWELPVSSLDLLSLVSFVVFFYVFPSGRFTPPWMRWMAIAWGFVFVTTSFFPDVPFGLPSWPVPLQIAFLVIWLGSLVAAQVYRYRRVSSLTERQQTKWVVFGVVTAIVGFLALVLIGVLFPSPGPIIGLIGKASIHLFMLLIPISITVAIWRYRLWDIDILINRALVYGVLTACVVGLYVLVVGGLGALLQSMGSWLVSLLATSLIVVLFAPLRDRLQRGVNRLMYGERDDPYAVLSRLGQRLEAILAPAAVLPTAVQTVAESLKLPYAALEVERDGSFEFAAATGEPAKDTLRLPLHYGGETVGRLVLGRRAGEADFGPSDRRLLDDLTRQVGVAVHAARLTEEAIRLSADLQRSRERLVTAREEERRRLRRDLHDGLGPQLASLSMKAEAARDLLSEDPARSDALLEDITAQTQEAVTDVRRLVYGLRPPALDDLGLTGALKAQAAHGDHGGLRVSVEAPDGEALPPLPAAVEVAAYRIAQEAVTNAARHAGARNCTVRISPDEEANVLRLDITDDGRGIPENRPAGVGLSSMRERAGELGGSCAVEAASSGGTRVVAVLPLSPVAGDGGGEG